MITDLILILHVLLLKQIIKVSPSSENQRKPNRVRERYLHQLGLQQGSQHQGPMAAPTHQLVVIGLPSLPKEKARNVPTNLHLETHDFSNYQNCCYLRACAAAVLLLVPLC